MVVAEYSIVSDRESMIMSSTTNVSRLLHVPTPGNVITNGSTKSIICHAYLYTVLLHQRIFLYVIHIIHINTIVSLKYKLYNIYVKTKIHIYINLPVGRGRKWDASGSIINAIIIIIIIIIICGRRRPLTVTVPGITYVSHIRNNI